MPLSLVPLNFGVKRLSFHFGISGSIVHIEDEHGFDRKMDSKYVVPQRKIQHSNIDLHQKDSNEVKSQSTSKPKIEVYEIYLHIESLFARNLLVRKVGIRGSP